jgi:hypothetical protein
VANELEKEAMGLVVNISTDIQAARSPSTIALMSIAISMKRIADEVCGNGSTMKLTEWFSKQQSR